MQRSPKSLDGLLKEANVPGASVAVVQDKIIISQEAGIVDIRTSQKISPDTVFEAASLSKSVFAYIVLKLIEGGLLSKPGESAESGLDTPLYEIAEFGPPHLRMHPNYKLLTARMILSHQAGLPNWFQPNEPENFQSDAGNAFHYSGVAYCFLNEVIEKKLGKSLHEISQGMFKRLGMMHSSFVAHEEESPERINKAVGHDINKQPDLREHFPRTQRPNPAASMFTTADEFAKFLIACANDPFIKKYMFEPQISMLRDQKGIDQKVPLKALSSLQWGLGVGLQKSDDGRLIAFHWGDVETSRSFFAIDVQAGMSIVCFTNSANGPAIFRQLAEPIVGDLGPVCLWLSIREKLNIKSTVKEFDASLAPAGLNPRLP